MTLESSSKYSRQNRNIEGILKIWNDENTNLQRMAQQLTNQFKEMNGKDDAKFTCWVLLIKKDRYKFDKKVKDKSNHYYEYSLPGGFLCVGASKSQPYEYAVNAAKYIRKNIKSQAGIFAEQNIT